MKNNVYGIIGIGVKNGMWNAGMDKYPKTSGNGVIKGSPYALQFCYKNQWNQQGKNVMGLKSFSPEGDCLNIMQKYETLTGDTDGTDYITVLNNLLDCEDVKNFGIVYTAKEKEDKDSEKSKKEDKKKIKKVSTGIRGIVQFADGINKYKDTEPIVESVMSPYVNQNKEDATATSLGERITVDEAHYIYDFSLFADQYNDYKKLGVKGYTREDYNNFKETSLKCVTNYNSKAKSGCKNEMALFIETKEETNYLLNLSGIEELIEVYKEGDEVIYDLTKVAELLREVEDKVKDIELYYNPRTLDIKGWKDVKNCKIYDIITRGEI